MALSQNVVTKVDYCIIRNNVAEAVGLTAAVILEKIRSWVEHNSVNGKNFYDGEYWTYNSMSAWQAQITYLSKKQISYAINNLIKDGYLRTGNYNKNKFDRTSWYTLTPRGWALYGINPSEPAPQSISQNCKMESPKLGNGNNNFGKSIVENCTNNTNIIPIYKQNNQQQYTQTQANNIDSVPKTNINSASLPKQAEDFYSNETENIAADFLKSIHIADNVRKELLAIPGITLNVLKSEWQRTNEVPRLNPQGFFIAVVRNGDWKWRADKAAEKIKAKEKSSNFTQAMTEKIIQESASQHKPIENLSPAIRSIVAAHRPFPPRKTIVAL